MKIDTRENILDYEGKPLPKSETDAAPLTIRDVFVTSINAQLKDEVFTAEQKAKTYQLSVKLYESPEVNLTVDDLSFIKERVGKVYNALVYGKICELIDKKE